MRTLAKPGIAENLPDMEDFKGAQEVRGLYHVQDERVGCP